MTNDELIKIANKEINRRNKISASKTGGKHSEETRAKLREAWKRRKARGKTISVQTGLEGQK
jgi:hypothetical protein